MEKVKIPVLCGFVVALSASILMLVLLGLGLLGPGAVSSNKEMIGGTILFLMIYLFLLYGIYFVLTRRKEQSDGRLSFREALIQGVITSLSSAVFSVIFTYVFYELLYPEYVNELLLALREKMQLLGISEDKISEKLHEKRNYYSTHIQSIYSFIGNLITGLTFTLLLSFFLKTDSRK